MKTFLKILLFVVVGLVVIHVFPILFVPVMIGFVALMVVGALMMGGVAAIAGVGLALLAGLLAVALVILAVLAPVWLPVLAIVGLVSLCRRRPKATV
jgi:hypothetical protein